MTYETIVRVKTAVIQKDAESKGSNNIFSLMLQVKAKGPYIWKSLMANWL